MELSSDPWDYEPCPRCGYENARCACPKNVPNPIGFSKEQRRALAEGVLQAIREAEASKPLDPNAPPPPPVQEMTAAEFVATYRPEFYGDNWDEAAVHPDFLAGGDWGWDMDELCESIAENGILDPVEVLDGDVNEGHHRVVAALRVNQPVRFRVW